MADGLGRLGVLSVAMPSPQPTDTACGGGEECGCLFSEVLSQLPGRDIPGTPVGARWERALWDAVLGSSLFAGGAEDSVIGLESDRHRRSIGKGP